MRLLIYGSKDFARTVAELIVHCGHDVAGLVDDFNAGAGVLGTFETVRRSHPPSEFGFVVAIGYSNIPARWEAWNRINEAGYEAPALIHPRAYVADSAHIERGAMIMAGSIVDVRARVDEIAVLWPGACVNHDARVQKNTFISPNATLCGFADVGAHSFVGAGTVVVDHGQVPEGSFLNMLTRYIK